MTHKYAWASDDVVWEVPAGEDNPQPHKQPAKSLTYRERLAILLGGEGSGNFGHSGRPGEVGGSAAGPFYHGTSKEIAAKIRSEGLKPLSDIDPSSGIVAGKGFASTSEKVALSYAGMAADDTVDTVTVIVFKPEASQYFKPAQKRGFGPPGSWPHARGTEMSSTETVPPEMIQEIRHYKLADVLETLGPRDGKQYADWESPLEELTPVSLRRDEGQIYVAILTKSPTQLSERLSLGGAGSGNFGHAGRPGEVGGSAEGGGKADEDDDKDTPRGQKRREFMAMVEQHEQAFVEVDQLRAGVVDAWKAWSEEITNRKRPLKADGAAAKKLDSYKKVVALEAEFQSRYEEARRHQHAVNEQASELLKVPPEQRSEVRFTDDPVSPLNPHVSMAARKHLAQLRQFDASGSFTPVTISKDIVQKFRQTFGDKTPLVEKPDGTFVLPADLRLGKAEGSRSHATFGAVNIATARGLEETIYHEVAHHIELKNPAVLKAAVKLRESLADTPREVYKLNTIKPGLDDDEIAVRGKFPDPYAGKIYKDDLATEMVSTGVQSYLTDPVRFAKERPEHFRFIFDVMQGRYREKS